MANMEENIGDMEAPAPMNQEKGDEEIEKFICPSCETEVASEATICPNCSATFQDEEPIPPPSDIEEEPYIPEPIEQLIQPDTAAPPEILPPPSRNKIDNKEEIIQALRDYEGRRKKRYLSGALCLGLGIILFVLLWIVVVSEVIVTETQELIGAKIIFLLIAAGILFIIGLFLILTYPSSSVNELLVAMPATPKTSNPGPGAHSDNQNHIVYQGKGQ